MTFDALLDWGPNGLRSVAPGAAAVVVVDVLSFTTAVSVALSRGAVVLPYRWADGGEAAYAEAHGAVLASARRDATGDDGYSLSPASLLTIPPGTRLVLPSPNGSALSFAAAEHGAGRVVAGCLRNAPAVGAALRPFGEPVAIVAAGERWHGTIGPLRVAVEDLLGAGAVLAALDPARPSPEAEAAMAAFERLRDRLPEALHGCPSGQELDGEGYRADVDLAADHGVDEVVPVLREGMFAEL